MLFISMLLGNGYEIIEFPLQQWLRERTKILCYTYITCHVLMCCWPCISWNKNWSWPVMFSRGI